DRPLDGRFRRSHGRGLPVHPQGPGRLRDGNADPRAQGGRRRRVQGRDRAGALVLAKRSLVDREGLPILAEIKGHATHSQEPQWFTTAPIPAIRKLLEKTGWSAGDV